MLFAKLLGNIANKKMQRTGARFAILTTKAQTLLKHHHRGNNARDFEVEVAQNSSGSLDWFETYLLAAFLTLRKHFAFQHRNVVGKTVAAMTHTINAAGGYSVACAQLFRLCGSHFILPCRRMMASPESDVRCWLGAEELHGEGGNSILGKK